MESGEWRVENEKRPAEEHTVDAASAGRVFMDLMAAGAIEILMWIIQLREPLLPLQRELQLREPQLQELQLQELSRLSCHHDGYDGS